MKNADSMEKQFLKTIYDYQGIIYKVSALYRNGREDREDLFQEIVYQLWKSYPGFNHQAKISSWMYRIALNTALTIYRKARVPVVYYGELPYQFHPLQQEDISENEERLFEAFRSFNDPEKALIALYLEDFSYKEMAEITGISETNIGVRLHRIKNRLKEIIK